MAERTPKPWVASEPCSSEFYVDEWYVDRAGEDVASIAIVNGEANARLIAAAPEILTALEQLLTLDDPTLFIDIETAQRFDDARAAIAKARLEGMEWR